MPVVQSIIDVLEQIAPTRLAEEWDNVGLLVGDRMREVERVMTCLTLTEAVADEAARERVDLVVTHHPIPFQPIRRITADAVTGRVLLKLIAAGTAVYSPHTAFDSAAEGINRRLADGIGLTDVRPLVVRDDEGGEFPSLGTGRYGRFDRGSISLAELATRLKAFLSIDGLQIVGESRRNIAKVAVACGSGGEFLAAAGEAGCDCLVTGEVRFHAALEAESLGVALAIVGHYASERFAVEALAEMLRERLPSLEVWASRSERDPIRRA